MERKILDFIGQYIIALISVIISGVLFWNFSPDDTVSIKLFMWFVIPLGLCVVVGIPQLIKYWSAEKEASIDLPHLILIKDNRYIFSPSELFSFQAAVSLYVKDDVERYIGYGKVESVISNSKNLQVIIEDLENDYTMDFLTKNKKNIILKPTIPFEQIQKLRALNDER